MKTVSKQKALKKNGTLKKGFRYVKGGKIVEGLGAPAKRKKSTRKTSKPRKKR